MKIADVACHILQYKVDKPVFEGPAILEQFDCTTVTEPGDRVVQDTLGNLLISVKA